MALCSEPAPRCRPHAEMFYRRLVRIGAALAELNRLAPSGSTIWEQQEMDMGGLPIVRSEPKLGAVCCIDHCQALPRSANGKYCVRHLQEARKAHSINMGRLRRGVIIT